MKTKPTSTNPPKKENKIQYLKRLKESTFRRIIILLSMGVTIVVLAFFNWETLEYLSLSDGGHPGFIGLIVSLIAAYFILFVIAFFLRYRSIVVRLEEEQERLIIRERFYPLLDDKDNKETKNSKLTTPEEEYFSKLVALNIESLSTYYIQVKEHAGKSFFASLTMAVLGYVLICSALIGGFISPDKSAVITYVTAGSGILIEFVSAIFFYLYNKTVAQMKEYHDSLLEVQNTLLSLRLIEGIDDSVKKHGATLQIIANLVGKNTTENDIKKKKD